MKIGIDIDGVLADFNSAYIKRVVAVTGRDLFPARPFDIPTWNYPELYGYTDEEVARVWESIESDRVFWFALGHYDTTHDDMSVLVDRIRAHHDDVYFITARPGIDAKKQTEMWLQARIGEVTAWNNIIPTVLITSHKGLAIQTLGLDIYIDDRWENCLDAAGVHWAGKAPSCRTFVMDRPWNRQEIGWSDAQQCAGNTIARVSSIVEMFYCLSAGSSAGSATPGKAA